MTIMAAVRHQLAQINAYYPDYKIKLSFRDGYGVYREYVEQFMGNYSYTYASHGGLLFRVTVEKPNGIKVLQIFYISQMPGCCGVAIPHSMSVDNGYNNYVGLNKYFNAIRRLLCLDMGFSLALLADKQASKNKSTIVKSGYKTIAEFNNKRTGNACFVAMFDLRTWDYAKEITSNGN